MLKKTITYMNFNDEEVVEDFYFNLNKAEIAEMELSYLGGLSGYLTNIVKSEDGAAIIAAFKDIIGKSYGQRSEDGRHFYKSKELTQQFMQSNAYAELFMELVTNAEAAANFVQGVVPKDLKEKVEAKTKTPLEKPTRKDLLAMSKEELLEQFNAMEKSKTA